LLLSLLLLWLVLVRKAWVVEETLSLLFRLFLVGKPPPGYLVLRAGLVPVAERVSEGRGDFLSSERLTDFGVSAAVVS